MLSEQRLRIAASSWGISSRNPSPFPPTAQTDSNGPTLHGATKFLKIAYVRWRREMARMIPSVIDPQAPASERRVFEALRDLPETERWTVLHSLGLSNAYSGNYGEIDFVVFIPKVGIVCVEVKGGGVSHRDGVWTTRNRMGEVATLKRSPFRQAQDAMWKLRKAIEAQFGRNSPEAKCPVGWIVILPDILCPPPSTEFTRREVIDRNDLDGDLAAGIRNVPSLVSLLPRHDLKLPSEVVQTRVLFFVRPNFDRVMIAASNIWEAERRISCADGGAVPKFWMQSATTESALFAARQAPGRRCSRWSRPSA